MKKQDKGITLIALVITIIILLILAGISIISLTGNGLFEKAKLAKNRTEEAQKLENQMLQEYENQIDKLGNIDGKWIETSNGITNGEITLQIGDYINYIPGENSYTSPCGDIFENDAFKKVPDVIERGTGYIKTQTFNSQDYSGGWRLLGIDEESGGLKLISSDIVKTIEGSDYYLSGYTGYVWGMTELNNICKIFGGGKGCKEAKSIEMNDINKITGYNPLSTGNGKVFQEGEYQEYGSEVTYSWYGENNDAVISENSNGRKYTIASGTPDSINFNLITNEGNKYFEPSSGEICTVKSTGYRYYATTLTNNKSDELKGISVSDNSYNTLYYNEQNENISFWTKDKAIYAESNTIWYIVGISDGESGLNAFLVKYLSNGNGRCSNAYGVRPIIILEEGIEIKRW